MKGGAPLPSLHSAQFAPDREPTLKAAIAAEVIALRTLMPKVALSRLRTTNYQLPTTNAVRLHRQSAKITP